MIQRASLIPRANPSRARGKAKGKVMVERIPARGSVGAVVVKEATERLA